MKSLYVIRFFILLVFCSTFFKEKAFSQVVPYSGRVNATTSGLEEIIIGDKKAPITVVVYLSFGCAFCKKFIDEVLPKLHTLSNKRKVKIYLRHFADNRMSKIVFMFVRCLGGNSTIKVQKLYMTAFKYQDELSKMKTEQEAKPFLDKILPNMKISTKELEACRTNIELSTALEKSYSYAKNTFGISSTPAFIIINKDGKKQIYQGFLDDKNIIEKIQSL